MNQSIVTLLLAFGIPLLVGVGVSIFAKKLPKRETYLKFFKPKALAFADCVGKFLNIKFGTKASEELEEGIICTLGYWISKSIEAFCKRLIFDNKRNLDPDYWTDKEEEAVYRAELKALGQEPSKS